MAMLARSAAALRYFGDDLNPDFITKSLGKSPTSASMKGQVTRNEKTGSERIAKRGSWILDAKRREPGDLDAQIKEIFDALTQDLSVWRELAERYKPDLFVGLFLEKSNEGIEISAESVAILQSRGVSIDLDIYGADLSPTE